MSESFIQVNKECFHFSWLSPIAAVGSFHAGCSQHEHMGGVRMCATGIKHSYVLYHSSFFWYLHEHRHVHSLKIRQCATHSVDNSTERARERGVGAYWKLQLERGQFLHLLIAKLKLGDDFKNDWWTKNMNRSHPPKKKIKREKIKCLFTLIGSVNFLWLWMNLIEWKQ